MNKIEKILNGALDKEVTDALIPLIDELYDGETLNVSEAEFIEDFGIKDEYNEYLDGGDNELPYYIASLLAKYAHKLYGKEYNYHWTEGTYIAYTGDYYSN